MKRIMAWLKQIRIAQVLTVFMAGILLFVSTACSGAVSAQSSDQLREEVPSQGVENNPYEGGMNDYSDVDPRRDIQEQQSKAQKLEETAQKNLKKAVDSPEQYGENYQEGAPITERVKNLGEDISESAQKAAEDVTQGAQKNAEKVKEGAQEATKNVSENVQSTAESAKASAKEASESAAKTAQKAKKSAKEAGESVAETAQKAIKKPTEALD
jgi:hypothetical protein